MCELDGGLNDRGSITAKELVTRVHLEEKEQQHLLMRLREKIKKKLGKRDRYMKELYDYLAASSKGEAAGAAELCDLFEEFLKVDIAEAEAWDILHVMNFNGDGVISLNDFMAFMGPQGLELLETNKAKLDNNFIAVSQFDEAIVDVKVSTSSSEELTLGEQEYNRVEPHISGTTGKPVYLWYKRWSKGGGGARLQPIVDFLIHSKSVNSALVVDGYQCIQKNLNSRSALSRPKYLWIRRAASEEEGLKGAIEDIAITTGKAKDRTSKIHNPPGGVFVHVPGNLSGGIRNEDIFLWYKPVRKSRVVNGKRLSSFLRHGSEKMSVETTGFHLSSTLSDEGRREELRKTIRRLLRQHFLNNSAGCVDYAGIFNRFDTKGRGKLKRVQVQKLLREVGLNLDLKELNLFMGHIDAGASHSEISRDDFLRFVQLTDDELDGICKLLRKRFGISKPLRTVKLQREMIKKLRCQYESLDADGDGLLSHKEFANMFEVANIFLTAEEIENIRNSRFDIDGDGRVDFLNFLQFFFSKENKDRRSASRVLSAVDVLRTYILSLQKCKEQGQNDEHVDSTTGWMELRKRHMTNHRYFNGYFVAEDIEMALKKLNIRLSQREIHQTVQCIAPLGNGRISEKDFHQFACIIPRSIGEVLNIVEKNVLPMMIESYRRLCHSRMRQVHQKRNIGRNKSSSRGAQSLGASCNPSSSMHASTGNNTRRPWSAGSGNKNRPRNRGSAALQGNVKSNSSSPFHTSRSHKSFEKGNDTEKTDIWEVYTDLKERAEIAMKCNDEGFTTVENLCNGLLCENGGKYKSGTTAIRAVEWIILSQFVGADIPEKYLINGSHLLEGICMAVLDEDNGLGGTNLEEMLDTNEEALNLVCEDLVKAIQDEARLPDGSLDYSKPFILFDENGDGIIPIDEFRNMLYRLNVDIPLREKQIVELMNRFDVGRSGYISLKEFEAFAERYTWTQNSKENISKQNQTGTTMNKVVNNDDIADDHPSRFEGYLVTGNRASDAFVIGIARALRAACANQQVAAKKLKQYFGDSVNVTSTEMVSALDRAGLIILNKLDATHKSALQPLCLASGLLNTAEFVGTILKAWRILSFSECHVMGAAISGSKKLDVTLANIQAQILGSGGIFTNDEHVGRTNSMKVHTRSSIESVFNSIDDNGSGFISPLQLQEGFKLLGFESHIKYKELQHLFRIFDPCEDGKISYIELCDFLLHGKFRKSYSTGISATPSDTTTTTYRRDVSLSNEIDMFTESENLCDEFDELFHGVDTKDEWAAARAAMEEFCPTPSRKKKLKKYLQSQVSDQTSCNITNGTFRRFLCRALGPESSLECHRLSYDDVKKIMRLLSSKETIGGCINYKIFLDMTLLYHDKTDRGELERTTWGEGKIHIPSAIITHIQESITRSALDGKTFYVLFGLSDEAKTGLVTRDALRVTLCMLGCRLSDKDEEILLNALPACDGMVDYEALYRQLMNHPSPPHMSMALHHTPYNRGGGAVLSWPSTPPIPLSTEPSAFLAPASSDGIFEAIAARVRQNVLELTKQWGPMFSLPRQFQFHDPLNQGITTADDFFTVIGELGIRLYGMEAHHLQQLFDRYGNGTMDYQNFCFRVFFSNKETELFSQKLSTRLSELRRSGMDVRYMFGMFDAGKTGFISRKDFKEVLKKLNVPVTDHQVQCMQEKFRHLGNADAVSYEDFLAFFASSNPPLSRTTTEAATQRSPRSSMINPWGAATNPEPRMVFQCETLDNYKPESSGAAARKPKSPSHQQLKVGINISRHRIAAICSACNANHF